MGFYIGPLLGIPASFGSGPCWVTMGPLFNSAFYFANILGFYITVGINYGFLLIRTGVECNFPC